MKYTLSAALLILASGCGSPTVPSKLVPDQVTLHKDIPYAVIHSGQVLYVSDELLEGSYNTAYIRDNVDRLSKNIWVGRYPSSGDFDITYFNKSDGCTYYFPENNYCVIRWTVFIVK